MEVTVFHNFILINRFHSNMMTSSFGNYRWGWNREHGGEGGKWRVYGIWESVPSHLALLLVYIAVETFHREEGISDFRQVIQSLIWPFIFKQRNTFWVICILRSVEFCKIFLWTWPPMPASLFFAISIFMVHMFFRHHWEG